MNAKDWVREYGDPRVHVALARSEPCLGTVYRVEGEGSCFHVLGLGFFTFLPGFEVPLADLCEPLCRVPSVEIAVAGLVLASRADESRWRRALGGDTHV